MKREEIEQLERRLRRERTGALTDISNRTTDAVFAAIRFLARWLRRAGEERPLISLLLAFQAGFAVGHWGPRRANH